MATEEASRSRPPTRERLFAEASGYLHGRAKFATFVQKFASSPHTDRHPMAVQMLTLHREVEDALTRVPVQRPEDVEPNLLGKIYNLMRLIRFAYASVKQPARHRVAPQATAAAGSIAHPVESSGLMAGQRQAPVLPMPGRGEVQVAPMNGALQPRDVLDILKDFALDTAMSPEALRQAYDSGQVWNKFGPLLAAMRPLCANTYFQLPAELARFVPQDFAPITVPPIPPSNVGRLRDSLVQLCRQLTLLESACNGDGGDTHTLYLTAFLSTMNGQVREVVRLLGGSAKVSLQKVEDSQTQVVKRALCRPLSASLAPEELAMVPETSSLTIGELVSIFARVCSGAERVQVEVEGLSSPVSPVGRGPRQARLIAVRVHYHSAAALHVAFADTHGSSEAADHKPDLLSTSVHIPAVASCEAAQPFELPQLLPSLHSHPQQDEMPFVSIHGANPVRPDTKSIRSSLTSLRTVSTMCNKMLRDAGSTSSGLQTFALVVRRAAAFNCLGNANATVAAESSKKRLKVEPSGDVVTPNVPAILENSAVHYAADTVDSDLTHFLEDFDDPTISFIGLV